MGISKVATPCFLGVGVRKMTNSSDWAGERNLTVKPVKTC